jgi:UDP-2,4-diacetamido-2,4,6-trideoxy-beta-L-altropyranose hydrolase
MGGGDTARVTDVVLRAFSQSQHAAVVIDIVMGVQPDAEYVRAIQSKLINAKFHYRVDCIAELMASADLAIGATGVATWERAALGLPTLAVSMADNQRSIARHVHAAGLLTWLGDAQDVSSEDWAEAINDACNSADRLLAQSRVCLHMVDAKGAKRVAEAML